MISRPEGMQLPLKPERTIVSIHAHPDDEASKGAATIAKYAKSGARAILICATGGEEGDFLNPAFGGRDRKELPEIRHAELDRSAAIIGYAKVERLGFRDSGMPDSPANAYPTAFVNRPLEEAVRGVVATIRRERPAVLISYAKEQPGYPHPDHLRVYEVASAARERANDPSYAPELGAAFQVPKWYWSLWVRSRFERLEEALADRGIEVPFRMSERMGDDELVTTRIDIGETVGVAQEALRAHATQVDPASPFWFAFSPEELARIYPYEEYHLVDSVKEGIEEDLFEGVF
ncbi:MAG: PIG-L family deacetylase [Ferrimicrobium sp.]